MSSIQYIEINFPNGKSKFESVETQRILFFNKFYLIPFCEQNCKSYLRKGNWRH